MWSCDGALDSDDAIFPATVSGAMSFHKGGSPDIEAGSPTGHSGDFDDGDLPLDPFDITRTKDAPIQSLRRWRVRVYYSNF